nr:hypothetical protein [Candidatus Poseidoniales archaeon]
MKKIAFSILAILIFSTALPLASAVTETQFSDGSSTFTHVFSTAGDAATQGVTLPFGAEVSDVEFEIEGSSSTQSWFNRTSNADFGGQGTTGSSQWGWSINQNGWNYGYRQNVKIDNNQLELRPTEDTTYWSMSNTNQAGSSTGGSMNTTGQYFATAEAGYNGMSDTSTKSVSGGTWNYMGPVVKQGDEIHVVRYGSIGSYGGYQLSAINRYNATTGVSIGTASIQYNNCSSNNVYYITDATSDGDGTVWMTSFYTSGTQGAITKWSVTYTTSGSVVISTYKCERAWTVLEVGGISIDPITDKMYVVQRVRLTNQYSMDLWEVSRSSPNIALQTWSLGIISPSGSQTNLNSYARPAGLDVQMPRISVNVYCYYYAYSFYCDGNRVSWMNVYHQRTNWPELQGEFPSSYAIMGIENIDGELATTCMYGSVSSYCPSATTMRKISMRGHGSADWMGTPTSNSATITSSMQTLSRSISELSIGVAITWEPTGTSIDFEVTNDGGTTWKRANSAGQTITFANAGNSLGWRAWLNGTASAAPLLDTVGLTYAATFASSGQWRTYRITSGSFPDAAMVWWNASTPGGSSLDIYFRASSSCTSGTRVNVPSSGSTMTFSQMSGSYLSLCIDLDAGTSNQYTPTLYDINIALYENAPQDVKIDIYDTDSTTAKNCPIPEYEWEHDGTLLGTTTAESSSGNSDLEDAFNCIVPQSGSGTEVVGVKVHSSTPGKVEIKSIQIEYTMVTVNLDINLDENMVLHERVNPYEIVTRHVIGDEALSITDAELTFLASPNADAPKLSWAQDGTLVDDDPEDWIVPDQSSTWTNLSNGIFEIHWMFRVTDDFPEQNNVGWRVSCTDDNGFSPATLSTSSSIVVNQSYGLGWFAIHDVEGEVVNDDVQNGDWVVAGETIHFQGQVWFEGTQDAPLNSVFDIRIARKDSQGDFVSATWKDNSNPNGTFFISVAVPDMDIPEGVTFEVQAYNVRDPTKVMPTDDSWRRTLRIDDSTPEIIDSWPADGDYEASSVDK